jgi:surface antigen
MNPVLLGISFNFTRKYFAGAIIATAFIISLPVLAVGTLGKDTLTYLGNTSTGSSQLYEGPPVPGDTYAWGNCTYWAYAMRYWAHNPIPTSWGNANTWASNAIVDGYQVDHKPSVGAVMTTTAGSLGHVAYVTKVDSMGNWTISEMNAPYFDVVSSRTFPPSQAIIYNFIHDKVK